MSVAALFLYVGKGECPVDESRTMGGKKLDFTKATDDLMVRITTMAPALLKGAGGPSSPRFAALCSAMGVLLSGWQQHLESAMVESPAAALGHATLIERLTNLHKYFLVPFQDFGPNAKQDEQAYNQQRMTIKAFAKGKT